MDKIYTAAAENQLIKIYDATTGSLLNTISTGNKIISTPVVSGNLMTVMVINSANMRSLLTYIVPGGTLKTSIGI